MPRLRCPPTHHENGTRKMTPLIQTIFGNGEAGAVPGNCMQTAVASLLDLPLDEVPHFVAEADWWGSYLNFVRARGLQLTIYSDLYDAQTEYANGITTAPIGYAPNDQLLIACGNSPRGFYHDVIWIGGRDGHMVHDPHPSQAGFIDEPDQFWLLTPQRSQQVLDKIRSES